MPFQNAYEFVKVSLFRRLVTLASDARSLFLPSAPFPFLPSFRLRIASAQSPPIVVMRRAAAASFLPPLSLSLSELAITTSP